MMRYPVKGFLARFILASLLMVFAPAHAGQAAQPSDVVATVGDQDITFSEINTMMNSSAIVGLSMPELGSPERDTVRITILDKMISANLIYLDALRNGADKDPEYQQDIQKFSDAILSVLYKDKYLIGKLEVSEEEIREFYKTGIMPGVEFTEEVRMAIEAHLRKTKFKAKTAEMRQILREGVSVVIEEEELKPDDDEVRDDAEVVARIDAETIPWGEVREQLGTPINAGSMENRLKALNDIIDTRIMASKGRAAGLEQDPRYVARVNEFKKTRLINLYRDSLSAGMQPGEEEIDTYYDKNRDRIVVREVRKVQMVVLKTREEAEEVKKKLDSGKITMYQAAADFSIVPDAKQTLGQIGWVTRGSGFPELDELSFSLGPAEIGGPVESPAGWHLVTVQDVRDAAHEDIQDEATRKVTRRLILDERMDAYVISLRKTEFPVEVHEETMARLSQEEVDWYNEVAKQKELSNEKVKANIRKLMK